MSNEVTLTTLFTKEYLAQAKVMIDSYLNSHQNSRIHVLALDEVTYNSLLVIYGQTIEISQLHLLSEIFNEFRDLQANRNFAESVFTLKVLWISYLLNIQKPGTIVLYADADLYFFERIIQLDDENWSVLLSPHYFPRHLYHLKNSGEYNAGLIAFRVDKESQKVLAWWKNSVVQDCSLSKENGQYADQKYLESFFQISTAIKIFSNMGVNVGAWRLGRKMRVQKDGQSVILDGYKIASFHFHAFRIYKSHFYTGVFRYGFNIPSLLIFLLVYLRYIGKIEAASHLMIALNLEPNLRAKNGRIFLGQILRRPLELLNIWPRQKTFFTYRLSIK